MAAAATATQVDALNSYYYPSLYSLQSSYDYLIWYFYLLKDDLKGDIADLQMQIDEITCTLPVLDYFNVNEENIFVSVRGTPPAKKLFDDDADFCVDNGQSIDMQAHISYEAMFADTTPGLCLGIYKDESLVTESCSADKELNESLMIFWRETLHGESAAFSLRATASGNQENVLLPAEQFQYGVRIFGDCSEVVTEIPDDLCP